MVYRWSESPSPGLHLRCNPTSPLRGEVKEGAPPSCIPDGFMAASTAAELDQESSDARNRQGVHGIYSGKLRSISGAADLRELCPRPCPAGGCAVAAPRAGDRGRQRRGYASCDCNAVAAGELYRDRKSGV